MLNRSVATPGPDQSAFNQPPSIESEGVPGGFPRKSFAFSIMGCGVSRVGCHLRGVANSICNRARYRSLGKLGSRRLYLNLSVNCVACSWSRLRSCLEYGRNLHPSEGIVSVASKHLSLSDRALP